MGSQREEFKLLNVFAADPQQCLGIKHLTCQSPTHLIIRKIIMNLWQTEDLSIIYSV